MITKLHEESGNESCQVLLRRIKSIMDDIDKIYLGTKDIQEVKKYDEGEEKKNVAKTRKDLEKAVDLLFDVQDIIDDVFIYVEEWTEENGSKKESTRPSRKPLRNRLSEAESMMPDYTEGGSYCIWCYNELDADFGYDPGPQIVEDNLTQEYAEARAEELNASSEPFIQYWAERERERYW